MGPNAGGKRQLNLERAVQLRNTRKTRKGSNRISTFQPIRHSWSDHPMGESSNKMHHPQYSHIHWSFRAFRVFRSFPTTECRLNHLQVCRLSKKGIRGNIWSETPILAWTLSTDSRRHESVLILILLCSLIVTLIHLLFGLCVRVATFSLCDTLANLDGGIAKGCHAHDESKTGNTC